MHKKSILRDNIELKYFHILLNIILEYQKKNRKKNYFNKIKIYFKKYFQIFPEDLWITQPIHIRDKEVVCNDLLSVDCGIDSVFVSISHDHLKAIGEQYPVNRLGPFGNYCARKHFFWIGAKIKIFPYAFL